MRQVEKRFLGQMATAGACLDVVGALRSLAACTPPTSKDPFIENAVTAVSSIARHRHWEVILYDGVFLYVVVRFEAAVEELIEKAITDLPKSVVDYSDLPLCIKRRHQHGVAHIASRPKWYPSVDVDDAVQRLAHCLGGTTSPYEMVPEAFSKEHDNLVPKVLSELLQRLGIRDIWRHMGRYHAMQSHFGTEGDSASTRTSAQGQLAEMVRIRNEIAHPGWRMMALSRQRIQHHIRYLEVLVPILRGTLQKHLKNIARP